MKNVVLGIIGCFIVIYTAMLSLSIYSVSVRKNQMEKCLSSALMGTMNKYYQPNMYVVDKAAVDDMQVENELINNIEDRLTSDSDIETMVYVCDMEKGIISAEIEEEFQLPMGRTKTISCKKTIIADQPMEEN